MYQLELWNICDEKMSSGIFLNYGRGWGIVRMKIYIYVFCNDIDRCNEGF